MEDTGMRWSSNTLLARLLIGSTIPLVLFLGVGLVAGVVIYRLMGALQLEKHSHEVLAQGLLLNRHLDAMHIAFEWGGPNGARRFRDAQSAFGSAAQTLFAQVQDNPPQRDDIRDILDREERLSTLLEDSKRAGEANDLFKDLEHRIGAFIAVEEDLLDRRRARTEEQMRQSLPVIGGTAILALILTVMLSLRAARSVTWPIDGLRHAAGLLMAGRYQSVPPAGPTEIADLIVLFNHVALTLSERNSLLQQQEERYRTYIGTVAHILWSADANGAVVGDLPTWRTYTGQNEEEVLGAGWLEAVHPDDRPRVREAWETAVGQRSIFEHDFQIRSSAGEYRYFHCLGVPIVNGDGSVREWIGTCADTTEARQRAALEQQRDAAEAASRAKSEFLTRMSHELRTPLNAVIGMSKMLAIQRFGALNAKQLDYLTDITRAGEHLLALINDILDLSKIEAGKMEVQADSFAAATAVQTLASTLRPLAESRKVALELVPPAEEGQLQTDPARFRQVLYNLLSNAIKFTPGGGEVAIAWEWIASARLDAPVVAEKEGDAIRLVVRDTGVGIAAEDQSSIWDEFRQVRPTSPEGQQGTGLGLALTRRLVALLGGAIGLVSAVGEGSTFTVVLPRRLTYPAEICEPWRPNSGRPLALIIEDHGPTNKLLCDWLAGAGLRVQSAFDGQTGLEMVRRTQPALIVLDVHLPVLDGWQVLTELKTDPRTAGVPVVLVSVNDNRPPPSSFAVLEFFLKPVERDTFLRRLQELQPHLFTNGHPRRALVVDDDPMARKLFTDLLHMEKLEVVEAADGRHALECLGDQPVDLVLLDLMLPEIDGFAVVEELRTRRELVNMPVLVVTAKEIGEDDERRLQGRIQAILQKHDLTQEQLHRQLQALGLAAG
jgi:PAS domain S-box-containing protein